MFKIIYLCSTNVSECKTKSYLGTEFINSSIHLCYVDNRTLCVFFIRTLATAEHRAGLRKPSDRKDFC